MENPTFQHNSIGGIVNALFIERFNLYMALPHSETLLSCCFAHSGGRE